MWLRNDCALTECYKKYDQLIVVWIICRYTNEFSVLLYLLQYLCEYTSECHSVPQLFRHLYLTDLELHICIHFIVVLFIPVISSAMHASCFHWFYFLINM